MVEDLGGQNELVRARAIAQGLQAGPTGRGRADGGAGEDPGELAGLGRREAPGEAGDRRRQRVGRPLRRLTKACCSDVSSSVASSSLSAATTLTPSMSRGRVEPRRRTERARGRSRSPRRAARARSATRRRTAGRASRRARRRTGWSRGSRPRTSAPAPGTARTGWPGSGGAEVREQLDDVLRGSSRRCRPGCGAARGWSPDRSRARARARDRSARVERVERPELLGDDQRRVVGEHDPPGPDADRRRPGRDVRDRDRGRRAGHAGHVVVLGQPEALVPPALGVPGQIDRASKGAGRVTPFDDRGQVQDR